MIRLVACAVALVLMVTAAEARRVALVIGQNAYPGGASVFKSLYNPVLDARRMAALLAKHGFEVISCDGKTPACLDLDRSGLLDALQTLKKRATGARTLPSSVAMPCPA